MARANGSQMAQGRDAVMDKRQRRQSTGKILKCKTCVACRRRKTKCDKSQPRCSHCRGANLECIYPDDARSFQKSSGGEIKKLQSDLASLRRRLRQSEGAQHVEASPVITSNSNDHSVAYSTSPAQWDDRVSQDVDGDVSLDTAQATPRSQPPDQRQGRISQYRGPSSPELHLTGSVSYNGGIQVHGASSMLHTDPVSRLHPRNSPPLSESERERRSEMSKARLVAFASQQHQREDFLRQNPSSLAQIDFDGVEPDLATHLIDAHFNRQHYTFMITYRPAIMNSLIDNGPYCNKILLNAIYLSSSIYSGRAELRPDPDGQATGHRFLGRLRSLLAEYIDKPSIPTAAGLLLSGAILVSMGQMSAGWVHTGIAYRMILDLGCHLAVKTQSPNEPGQDMLQSDIDVEIRKRLFWGAFMTDATQSLYFGRPPTFLPTQARVSRDLLDTYEELQLWLPYKDEKNNSSHQNDGSYSPRPAYAISTFNGMVRLFEISSRIVGTFYSMESLTMLASQIRQLAQSIEQSLNQWLIDLPDFLKLDLDGPVTFAPHQMTLLTTYHTFQILLRRPYTTNGHLSHHFNLAERQTADNASIDAALAIHKLLVKYKAAFGLQRAPYLVSYSTYSAIVAILNQQSRPRLHFKDCMRFFWSALGELRRGSNFGLQKPMEILKEAVIQYTEDLPELAGGWDHDDLGLAHDWLNTESRDSVLPSMQTNSFTNVNTANGLFDDVLFGLFMDSMAS